MTLLPDVETLDQISVALRVFRLEVVQQPATPADQHQQSSARLMILCVRLEMFRQIVDAFTENGDLNFRGTGVGVVRPVVADQFGLAIFGQRHGCRPPRAPQNAGGSAPAPDAPYVANIVSRTRSACYISTTQGCKRPGARPGSPIPINSPRRSSSLTAAAPAGGSLGSYPGGTTSAAPRSRPCAARRTPSSVSTTAATAGSTRASGTRARRAASRSRSMTSRGTAPSIVQSPLRVRRSPARWAPSPRRSPRSCASDRT